MLIKLVACVLGGVIYLASLYMVYIRTKRKYSQVNLTDVNAMLSEILEANFRNNTLSNAAQSILIVLKRFYGIEYVTISIYQEATQHMEIIASNAGKQHLKPLQAFINESNQTIGNKASRVMTSDDFLTYPSAEARNIMFSSFTPLKHKGVIIGSILLESKDATAGNQEQFRMSLYDKIFNSTALVLQNVIYTENLIKLTSTDQLTGVYNRRFIDMTLNEQLTIHRNLGLSFTVVLFDIDHFKKFNDTYGHAFGDLVLKEVAAYVKRNLPSNAWIARYGGEEFVIFYARSEVTENIPKVEALRQGLEQLQLTDGTTTASVTASFGISSYPKIDSSVNDLVAKADEALYESKKTGRNRVTVA